MLEVLCAKWAPAHKAQASASKKPSVAESSAPRRTAGVLADGVAGGGGTESGISGLRWVVEAMRERLLWYRKQGYF